MKVILAVALILAVITLSLAILVYIISIRRGCKEIINKVKDNKNNPRK